MRWICKTGDIKWRNDIEGAWSDIAYQWNEGWNLTVEFSSLVGIGNLNKSSFDWVVGIKNLEWA